MSNIREGSVWRYQAFLIASPAMLWKKLLFSKCNAPVTPSNVEDCHLKLANNTPQKVIMKLSKRKDV